MAFKVYGYPKNPKEVSEDFEFIGDYTNYNEDEFEQLPYIGDEFPEIAKKFDKVFDNSATVAYVCNTLKELEKAYPKYNKGGRFWKGEYSFGTPNYYIINPEWGNTVIIIPKALKKKAIEYINEIEEGEELEAEKSYENDVQKSEIVKETNKDEINTLIENFKEIFKNSKYEEETSMGGSGVYHEDIWFNDFYEISKIDLVSYVLLRINFVPELQYEISMSFKADKADFKENFGGYNLPYEGEAKATYSFKEDTITVEFLKNQLSALRQQALENFESGYAERDYHTPQFLKAVQDTKPEKHFMSLMNSSKMNSTQDFLRQVMSASKNLNRKVR